MGFTQISGVVPHLPTKQVRLPLKYHHEDDSYFKPKNFSELAFVKSGVFANPINEDSTLSKVRYGLRSDLTTLILSPDVKEGLSTTLRFQLIEIQLPHKAFDKSTVLFQSVHDIHHNRALITIDIIDTEFLFITMVIDLENFMVSDDDRKLSVDNFDSWAHISVPYSFELRSHPFCLNALGENDLIISLKDGSLLHFKRKHLLDDFEIFIFSTTNILRRLLSTFFPLKDSGALHEMTSSLLACVQRIDEMSILTLSLDHRLSLYDLKLHKLVRDLELSAIVPTSNRTHGISHMFSKMVFFKLADERLIFLATSPASQEPDSLGCSISINAIEIKNGTFKVNEAFSFEGSVARESIDRINLCGAIWVEDYQLIQQNSVILHQILWRCNTTTLLTCHQQDLLTGVVTNMSTYTTAGSDEFSLDKLRFTEKNLDYNFLWDSGRYDINVILSAIAVLDQNSVFKSPSMERYPLRKRLDRLMEILCIDTGISIKSTWQKLYLLCEEYRRRGQQPVSLQTWDQLLVVCQANGLGVFRELHFFEDFSKHVAGEKVVLLLRTIKARTSMSSIKSIKSFMESERSLNPECVSAKAEELWGGKLEQGQVRSLVESLDPEVMGLIRDLVEVLRSEPSSHPSGEVNSLDGFTRLYAVNSFKTIIESHRAILLYLTSALLLCEWSPALARIFQGIHRFLRAYSILDNLFEICFIDTQEYFLEKDTVGRPEISLFWWVFKNDKALLSLIKRFDVNHAFDLICESLISQDFDVILAKSIIFLIDREEWHLAQLRFQNCFDAENYNQRFISGILALFNGDIGKFRQYVGDFDTFRSAQMGGFLASIFGDFDTSPLFARFRAITFAESGRECETSASYYHELSNLCKICSSKKAIELDTQDQLLHQAVEFEEKAVSSLVDSDHANGLPIKFQKNLFELSIKVKRFEGAYEALVSLLSHISRRELKSLLVDLVKALISSGKQNLLIKNFKSLRTQHQLIDEILFEEANDDLILWKALKTYELLYSWRMLAVNLPHKVFEGDKRAACEALYTFITRFKLEDESLRCDSEAQEDYKRFKLKVLELYMIIINLVKSIHAREERWIRVRRSKGSKLVDLKTLVTEYLMWLQLMEDISIL